MQRRRRSRHDPPPEPQPPDPVTPPPTPPPPETEAVTAPEGDEVSLVKLEQELALDGLQATLAEWRTAEMEATSFEKGIRVVKEREWALRVALGVHRPTSLQAMFFFWQFLHDRRRQERSQARARSNLGGTGSMLHGPLRREDMEWMSQEAKRGWAAGDIERDEKRDSWIEQMTGFIAKLTVTSGSWSMR